MSGGGARVQNFRVRCRALFSSAPVVRRTSKSFGLRILLLCLLNPHGQGPVNLGFSRFGKLAVDRVSRGAVNEFESRGFR